MTARSPRHRTALRRLGGVVFGDRIGILLFLVTLLVVSLTWRVGFLINDNYALANGLVALRDGSLHLTEIRFGPDHGMTPGVRYGDGYIYSRHYGMLVLALPIVLLLEGLTVIADLRVSLVAAWSLLLLACCVQGGRHLGVPRIGSVGGAVVSLLAFGANLHLATVIDPLWIPMIALQLQTMIAAALIAVVTYRFLGAAVHRRAGLVAGVFVGLGTPVGFWAPLPKRHVLVALLALGAIACFYRSRHGDRRAFRYRVGMYALIGLSAWVSPAEGLVLLAVIAPIDVATAPETSPRVLLILGGTLILSLVPMFVTNALITGNPLFPPRMLPAFRGQTPVLAGDVVTPIVSDDGGLVATEPSDEGAGNGDPSGGIHPIVDIVVLVLATIPDRLADLLEYLTRGIGAAASDPDRLARIFIHGGYMPDVAARDGGEAITLSLLESMPVLGGLLAALPRIGRPSGRSIRTWITTPPGRTDVLVIAYIVVLSGLYLHRLPTHATVTARYLVPTMPLYLYLLARLPPFQTILIERTNLVLGSMATMTLIGGQLVIAYFTVTDAALGEVVQFHARVALLLALSIALWAVLPATRRRLTLGAGIVGAAAGLVTVFLLLSSWALFSYAGPHAIPIAEAMASVLRFG